MRLEAQPARLTVEAGQEVPFKVIAFDTDGNPVDAAVRTSGPRGALRVRGGTVTGPGRVQASAVLGPNA